MGYSLNAIIGRRDDLSEIEMRFTGAKVVSLTDEIALIPMTEKLFDQMVSGRPSTLVSNFEYLNDVVEKTMLGLMGDKAFAYVEAEYFGGEGIQMGIAWKAGTRSYQHYGGQEVINDILKQFGVERQKPMDEFDTVRLGRHRSTERWIAEAES